MHAIPKFLPGLDVDPTGEYQCPICCIQKASDEGDTGWVSCPMLHGRMICLGCCIDHQKVARSEDFKNHPYADLFENLSVSSGRMVEELRTTCMRHQLEVIEEQVEENSEDVEELLILKSKILEELSKVYLQ